MNKKRITHLGYTLVLGVLLFVLASCGVTATTGSAKMDDAAESQRIANDAKLYASYRTGDINSSTTYTTASIKQEVNHVFVSTRILPVQLLGNNSNTVDLLLRSGDLPSNYLTARLSDGRVKFEIIPGVVPEYGLALDVKGRMNTRSVPLIVVQSKDWTGFTSVSVEDSSGAQVNKNSDKDLTPVVIPVGGGSDTTDNSGHLLLKFNGGIVPSNPDIYIQNSNEEAFSTELYRNDSGLFALVVAKKVDEEAVLRFESVDNSQAVTYVRVASVEPSEGVIEEPTLEAVLPLLYVPQSRSDSTVHLVFAAENLPAGNITAKVFRVSGDDLFQLGDTAVTPNKDGKFSFAVKSNGVDEFQSGMGTTIIATLYGEDGSPLLSDGSEVVATVEVRVVRVNSTIGSEQRVTLDRSCGVGSYAFASISGYRGSDTPSQVLSSITLVSAQNGSNFYNSFKLLDTTVTPTAVLACLSASNSTPLDPGSTVDVSGKVVINGFEVPLPQDTIIVDFVTPPPPPPSVESVLIASKEVLYLPESEGGGTVRLAFDGSKLPVGATIQLTKSGGNDIFDLGADSGGMVPDSNGDVEFAITALSGSDFVSGKRTVLTATVLDSGGEVVVRDGRPVSASTKVRVLAVDAVRGTSQEELLDKFCGIDSGNYAFAVVSGYPSGDTNSQIEGSITASQASTNGTPYSTIERLDTSTTPATMVACLDGSALGQGVTVSVSSSISVDGVEVLLPDGTITTEAAPPPPPPVITATLSPERGSMFLPTSEFGKDLDLVFTGTDLPSGSKIKITKLSGDNIFSLGTSTLSPGANGKVTFTLTALGESVFTPARKTVLQAQLLDASNQPILKDNKTVVASTEIRLLKAVSVLDNETVQKGLSAVCSVDSYAFAQVSGFFPSDSESTMLGAITSVGATGASGQAYSVRATLGGGLSPHTVILCVDDALGNELELDSQGAAAINGAVSIDNVSVPLAPGKIQINTPPPPITATLSADKGRMFLPSSEAGEVVTFSFTGSSLPSGSTVQISKVSGVELFTFSSSNIVPDSSGKAVFAGVAVSGSSFAGTTTLKAALLDSSGSPILNNGTAVESTVSVDVLVVESVMADASKQALLSGVCGTDSYAFAQVRDFAPSTSSADMLSAVSSVDAFGTGGNTYSSSKKVDSSTHSVVLCVDDVSGNKLVLDSNGDVTLSGMVSIDSVPVAIPSGKIHIKTPAPVVNAYLTASKLNVFLPTTEAGKVLSLGFQGTGLPSGSVVQLSHASGDNLFTVSSPTATPDSSGSVVFDITAVSGSSFKGATVLKAELLDSSGNPVLTSGSPVIATTEVWALSVDQVFGDAAKEQQLSAVCGADSYAFAEISGYPSGISSVAKLASVSSIQALSGTGIAYATSLKPNSDKLVACVDNSPTNPLTPDSSGLVVINGQVTIANIDVPLPSGTILLDFYIKTVDSLSVSPGTKGVIDIILGGKYDINSMTMRVDNSGGGNIFSGQPVFAPSGTDRNNIGPVEVSVSSTARRGDMAFITIYVLDSGSVVFSKVIVIRVQ